MGDYFRKFKIYQSSYYGSGLYGSGLYGVGDFRSITVAPGWRVQHNLNTRSLLSCIITDYDDDVELYIGKDFKFYDNNNNLLFAGIIQTIADYEAMTGKIFFDISVSDYNIICDRIRVADVYTSTTAGAIVNDIVTNYLAAEGVSAGIIETGNDVTKLTSNYLKISEIFNWLKTNTGFYWNIDENKQLNFRSSESSKSSIVITDNSLISNFKRNRDLGNYRNVQYLRGGFRRTTTQTDEELTPAPDGISRQFIAKYKIAEEPSISIDVGAGYVAVNSSDVGILGIDTSKKYYWTYGSDKITQDDSEVVLAAGHKIKLASYVGLTRLFLKLDSPAEIASRAAIEGGTGKYEDIAIDKSIDTIEQAQEFAKGLLNTYGEIKDIISFIADETAVGNFEVGELVKIDKNLYNIDDWFLIDQITITSALSGVDQKNVQYNIRCLDGASIGGWEEWFKNISNKNKSIELTNDEDIVQFIETTDNYSIQGKYTIQVINELYPSNTLYPADTLTPGTLISTEEVLD